MIKNWSDFLFPYEQAVAELKVKLRGIRKEFIQFDKRSPIEFVTGRVKPVESIKEKMNRRLVSEDRLSQDMEDIAGLRIMCPFVDDIYEVVDILRKEVTLISLKNAITLIVKRLVDIAHIILFLNIQLKWLMVRKKS